LSNFDKMFNDLRSLTTTRESHCSYRLRVQKMPQNISTTYSTEPWQFDIQYTVKMPHVDHVYKDTGEYNQFTWMCCRLSVLSMSQWLWYVGDWPNFFSLVVYEEMRNPRIVVYIRDSCWLLSTINKNANWWSFFKSFGYHSTIDKTTPLSTNYW
jgi:hypothetical protein